MCDTRGWPSSDDPCGPPDNPAIKILSDLARGDATARQTQYLTGSRHTTRFLKRSDDYAKPGILTAAYVPNQNVDSHATGSAATQPSAALRHSDVRESLCRQPWHRSRHESAGVFRDFAGLFRDFQIDLSDITIGTPKTVEPHIYLNVRDVAVFDRLTIAALTSHDIHRPTSEKHQQAENASDCTSCHVPDTNNSE